MKNIYDKIIDFLGNVKVIGFVNKYLKHDSTETLIVSSNWKNTFISWINQKNNEWIKYPLNNNTKKNGINLIKALQLKQNEYDKTYDEIFMTNYFCYKVYECFENSFDIWCDFALINPGAFNASFKILIKYLSITNSEKENKDLENDNTFPLDEEEDFK